ncbi:helix-turn-helix transcriptional regulator [Symbioplanes lichenis]|uniref:helix-turn-helix transcriptional regulator n=1 Tax=Symbioplanes lichenis TaxID=1629072 RepID=UPI002738881D|nr:transcriptional regulator [Actinoplanes lichenis]
MTGPEFLGGLEAVASLADRVRRQAYRFVVDAGAAVGRDEVAEALGVGRTLAAFHLDKLVSAGLLETSYARRSGRTGPGAGRPAKLYRPAAGEHAVSVPPRAYRGAGELLAEAIEEAGVEETLYRVAERHGRQAGAGATDAGDAAEGRGRQAGDGGGPVRRRGESEAGDLGGAAVRGGSRGADGDARRRVGELLAEQGYGPVWAGADRVELRNCPFHRLAEQFPPVVCGMNLALVSGLLAGNGLAGEWVARMDAAPGRCCVTVEGVASKNNSD